MAGVILSGTFHFLSHYFDPMSFVGTRNCFFVREFYVDRLRCQIWNSEAFFNRRLVGQPCPTLEFLALEFPALEFPLCPDSPHPDSGPLPNNNSRRPSASVIIHLLVL
jgi:hypothetical protein